MSADAPSKWSIGALLSGVPSTQPDANVVSLEPRHPHRMPRAMELHWETISRDIHKLGQLQSELASREREWLSDKARLEREITTTTREIEEAQGRVAIMLAAIGMGLKQEDEG